MKTTVFRAVPALIIFGALAAWALSTPSTDATPEQQPEVPAAMPTVSTVSEEPAINYVEVIGSCGPHFEGECLNIRSGPGSTFPAIMKLRDGTVLAVAATTTTDESGIEWYKVVFSEWIRYPERISADWYIASTYTRGFADIGTQEYELPLPDLLQQAREKLGLTSPGKRILVDRSEQKLYAYEEEELFLESGISTGLDLTPTPRGTFTIYKKTPSRYMQGPLPGISDQYYDLPGVPWNMYFTKEGGAIHGAYWHTEFGKQWSHGCVNLPLDVARTLYNWAPLGTTVIVQD